MTRDAPTAAGGCLTDHTIIPALPMPYNGGRVVIASRASPDEGRDAYAKWHLRSSASSDENTQGVDTERPLRRQRLDAGKYPLPRKAESEVQPCSNSFHWNDCCTQSTHQLPSLDEYYIASAAKRSKPSSTLDRRTPQREQVIRDPTRPPGDWPSIQSSTLYRM